MPRRDDFSDVSRPAWQEDPYAADLEPLLSYQWPIHNSIQRALAKVASLPFHPGVCYKGAAFSMWREERVFGNRERLAILPHVVRQKGGVQGAPSAKRER